MKIFRFALPLLAVVAVGVGAACTPVKQQFGKNILAYTTTNGCESGLPYAEPANSLRSPQANFARAVCTRGLAAHSVSGAGVTLQIVDAAAGGTGAGTSTQGGGSAAFVIGGLPLLGEINSIKVEVAGGSAAVGIGLGVDKNADGQFFGPPNSTGFQGDAAVQFTDKTAAGGQIILDNNRNVIVFSAPCAVPAAGGCFKPGPGPGGTQTLAQLKQGVSAGIDGNSRVVISVSLSTIGANGVLCPVGMGLGCPATADAKATVTSFQLNGVEMLP